MSKLSRRWWIGGVLLLIGVFTAVLWPRPIRIPLKDGTTLTIAAITVGVEHSRPEPLTWGAIRGQIARRQWGWPAQTITMPEYCVVLWGENTTASTMPSVTLVDRYGWRWLSSSAHGGRSGFQFMFPPIETGGSARVEVLGTDGLLGVGVVSIPTAIPVEKAVLVPTSPPIYTTPGEPAPLPIHRTSGPLEATLRSFELRSRVENQPPSEGTYQLETRWNGRPFTPQASLTITDRFGRRDLVSSPGNEPLIIALPPRDAIWDLHFFLFRGLDVPLDPEETVLVAPAVPAGGKIFQQEGLYRGQPWRLSFSASENLSFQSKFNFGLISVSDQSPMIVAEISGPHSGRIRIEPLDRDGQRLPATPLDNSFLPMNVFGVRCPGFDIAKGHTIRVGFEQPQIVQFTIRPQVTPKEPAK